MYKKYKDEILSSIFFVTVLGGSLGSLLLYRFFVGNKKWSNIIIQFLPVAWNCLITWFYSRHLQRQKGTLDKDVEKYKHELQVEFIKAELKTTQLFSIYPKIFAKFKETEGIIFQLDPSVPKRREVSKEDISEAFSSLTKANNYLVKNALFVSKETYQAGIKLKDLMAKYLANYFESRDVKFEEIMQMVERFRFQMQKELGNESKLK